MQWRDQQQFYVAEHALQLTYWNITKDLIFYKLLEVAYSTEIKWVIKREQFWRRNLL